MDNTTSDPLCSIKERLQNYLSSYEKGYLDSHALRWLHRNDPELYKDLISATDFLDTAALPKQRAWHVLNDTKEVPSCPYSGEPVAWQGSRYRAFNGKGSNNSDPIEQARRKDLFLERYGVENPAQLEVVKDKMKATNLQRYGSENYFSSNKGIQLTRELWSNPEHKAKRIKSIHQAFETKLGGFPYQNPEIFMKAMKNGFKYRDYKMPSGKIVRIQGYEDMALDELLEQGVDETDILVAKNEVPEIWYEFEGCKRRYYPDIHIVSHNRIIEVKSTFSYRYEEAKNQAKKEACVAAGFLFEFRIYSGRPK